MGGFADQICHGYISIIGFRSKYILGHIWAEKCKADFDILLFRAVLRPSPQSKITILGSSETTRLTSLIGGAKSRMVI